MLSIAIFALLSFKSLILFVILYFITNENFIKFYPRGFLMLFL